MLSIFKCDHHLLLLLLNWCQQFAYHMLLYRIFCHATRNCVSMAKFTEHGTKFLSCLSHFIFAFCHSFLSLSYCIVQFRAERLDCIFDLYSNQAEERWTLYSYFHQSTQAVSLSNSNLEYDIFNSETNTCSIYEEIVFFCSWKQKLNIFLKPK